MISILPLTSFAVFYYYPDGWWVKPYFEKIKPSGMVVFLKTNYF